MIKWTKEEEEAIQYIIAIAMIVFGMVLCMMGFWVSPVGIISNSVLAALGQILLLVGAIFHLNLSFKSKENHFESMVNDRLNKLEQNKGEK
jgi:hypothetical protein